MRFLFQGYRRLLTHPKYGIWVVLASLLYLISPIDLSPDLLPLLGQIDDVALIVLMLSVGAQWLSQQFLQQSSGADGGTETTQADETIRQTVDVKAVEIDATEG
jgi:uncharacterized membrane protein YkvA (DUF1232 family)